MIITIHKNVIPKSAVILAVVGMLLLFVAVGCTSSTRIPAGQHGSAGAPGLSAPRYFDDSWSTPKRLYVPGEPIAVMLTVRNIYHQPLKLSEASATLWQTHMGLEPDETNSIALEIPGDIPELTQTGEHFDIPITLPSDLTSTLATGRYAIDVDLSFSEAIDPPRLNSEKSQRLRSGVLFVVIPAVGALVKTVQVGEVRLAGGITMTLGSVNFGAEESTISVIVALPERYRTENSPNSFDSDSPNVPAPPPTRVASDQKALPTSTPADPAIPAPAATPAPRAPGSNIREISAYYQIDGGAIDELTFFEYGGASEAVYVEWTFGPLPSTAQSFEFSIMEMRIDPDEKLDGPWEWTVSLQNG